MSTLPGSKAPQSPDSHCDESTNKVERTTLTVEEESGLELKLDGMGVGHISVSVPHHDPSDARGDIMQHGRAAVSGDRSSHKTTGLYQNMTVVNIEQAKQRSCSHVFLTTTLDSASPTDADLKATKHATQQTNIRREDNKPEREHGPHTNNQEPEREPGPHTNNQEPEREHGSHTNNQEPAVTQSSVHESREGESISQEADIEAIGCSGGEQTVESSMFGVIGVSVQNTQSSSSANTAGQKATPRTQKRFVFFYQLMATR